MPIYMIGIDIGSTYTDGVCSGNGRIEWSKVETTPHDHTVCFMNVLTECTSKFGKLEEVLRDTEVVRWSGTTSTNVIVQKAGRPIGLIITRGFADQLYGQFDLSRFIPKELVAELDEEVNEHGVMLKEVDKEQVTGVAEDLLDRGARAFAVCLRNSEFNPANERKIKAYLAEEFPGYYLGSTETICASELTSRRGYFERAMTAFLNTYVHAELVRSLYKGDEELARMGYPRPMFVVQATAGTATVPKTVALSTVGSGPTAGLIAASFFANLYDIEFMATLDIGATTCDMGIAGKRGITFSPMTLVEGLPIYLYCADITSLGVGGGSIVKVQDSTIGVGPLSTGALPGPVCYDLGNEEPTLCDALLVLGYINPEYYEGGKRRLAKDIAIKALEKMAKPLNLSPEELSLKIKEVAESKAAQTLKGKLERYGIAAKDCVLMAYGGQGSLHACNIGDLVGTMKGIIPNGCEVLSGIGCLMMDVVSIYESFNPLFLQDKEGNLLSDYKSFNEIVETLEHSISLDMRIQGFKPEEVEYFLELEMADGAETFRSLIPAPSIQVQEEKDVKAICEAFSRKYAEAKGSGKVPVEGIKVGIFRLKGIKRMPYWKPVPEKLVGKDPGKAFKGKRAVFWKTSPEDTDIYQEDLLECGNLITGPAIIEGSHSTCAIPGGYKCSIDEYRSKVIEKVKGGK